MSDRNERFTVIYLRACEGPDALEVLRGHERNLRDRLTEAGIEHSNCIVLSDVGSSLSRSRPAFRRLMDLLRAGQVAVLATPSLCRLTRRIGATELVGYLQNQEGRLVLADGPVDAPALSVLRLAHEMSHELAVRLRRHHRTARMRGRR